ncbi:unnamed protein product [Leptosia nina]|uniref:Carboxylic ester hydrolase n=1 Tax=Leptosia nina TaxID=320188 RepID=A0AAV1K0D4_9NEOP
MSEAVWNLVIVLGLVYYIQVVFDSWERPLVRTKYGWVRGIRTKAYDAFLGIPYGRVNESNPFGAPSPIGPYNGTFEADDDSKICPHVEEYYKIPVGTLQCLNLHIYLPRKGGQLGKLPVLVYIFGGQFRIGHSGSAEFQTDYLVAHDVIIVKFDYRSGMYGFLCLGTPEIPGNQGLKDQVLALRWVKENIEHFGGDAERITIFGHSSGSMCLDFHVRTNPELFNQAILQSGTAIIPGGIDEGNRTIPITVAKRLGHSPRDLEDALEFLKTRDVFDVAIASVDQKFRPCIEKSYPGVKAYLTKHPMFLKPDLSGKNVVIGVAIDEYVEKICLPAYQLYSKDVFKININFEFDIDDDDVIDDVKQFYVGNEEGDHIRRALKFMGDFYFNYQMCKTVDMYFDYGAEKVYQYIFSYNGDRNMMKVMKNITNCNTATHGDDIGYIFKVSFMDKPLTKDDQLVIDRMTSMWTNFAKFGHPIVEKNNLFPTKWLPSTKTYKQYLVINKDIKMDDELLKNKMSFWYEFYKKYERFLKYKKR